MLQSFAFDERHGHMYALQVMEGGVRLPGEPRAYTRAERAARGDMCLNRLTMGGALTGDMYLLGFGHGSALGVEDTGRRGKRSVDGVGRTVGTPATAAASAASPSPRAGC